MPPCKHNSPISPLAKPQPWLIPHALTPCFHQSSLLLLKKITERCRWDWFQIYNHSSQNRPEYCQTAYFLGNLFSQLLRSLFTPSLLSSSFQHSFLSAPLSANDLALYFIEKRDAVGLEQPHLSTISSPTFLYLYSNTLPSFLLKREEDR